MPKLSPAIILSFVAGYFALLMIISWLTSRKGDNASFFIGNKQSPWYLVAFGMIGASLSGVTFISVPGWVGTSYMGYFQMVLGNFVGYLVIARVLLPLYYRLNLVSIYEYLERRFGTNSYKIGAFYFLLSRVIGASFRLYLVANVLQITALESFGVPFYVTVMLTIALIWLYTFRGGIKTIVWTDSLQTLFMLIAVGAATYGISAEMNLSLVQALDTVNNSEFTKIFNWDWKAPAFFWKQFAAGAFISIVMVGLDQDMMQKNLSCRNIKEAQKNMYWFSVTVVLVNLVFLGMGVLLYEYALQQELLIIDLDTKGTPLVLKDFESGAYFYRKTDDLFPLLATTGYLSPLVGIFFILGLIAAAYSSADSALTSLTTSFCVDFLGFNNKSVSGNQHKMIRYLVHLGFSIILVITILIFKAVNNDAVISQLFKAAGFTYGPLLGLFAFGLFTKHNIKDRLAPLVCILSPIISYLLFINSKRLFGGYEIGFEILIINGALTFLGLLLLRTGNKTESL